MPDPCAAAAAGDLAALRTALADANAPGADGWTPLHLAAHGGHGPAVDLLLASGADVGAVSANDLANTPLHAALAGAQDAGVVAALLAAGADPNATAGGGVRPLHLAASRGDEALAAALVAAGAVPAPMDDGQTPADVAEARGFRALADRLRTG